MMSNSTITLFSRLLGAESNSLPGAAAGAAGAEGARSAAQTQAQPNGSAFAALIAAMIGTLHTNRTDAGNVFLPELPASQFPAVNPESDAVGDTPVQAEELLAQLAAWVGALTAEQRLAIASHPEVSGWIAMAETELAMAGFDAEMMPKAQGPQMPNAAADDMPDPLEATIARLTQALPQLPDQHPLTSVVRQGFTVLTQAAAQSQSGADEQPPVTEAILRQGIETNAPARRGSPDLHHVRELLVKLNGTAAASDSGEIRPAAHQVRNQLLSVLEARASFVHAANLRQTAAAAESSGTQPSGAEAKFAEPQPEPWLGTQPAKASDGTVRLAAMPEQTARVPLGQLSERLGEWMARFTSTGGNVKTETVLRLVPEHLGSVEVKLSIQNGQLSATIAAETAMAKEALETNLAALRTTLQQHGVTVERLVVSQMSSAEPQTGMFQDGKQQQRQSPGQGEPRARTKDDGEEDWLEQLAAGTELESMLLTASGLGGAFRAKA